MRRWWRGFSAALVIAGFALGFVPILGAAGWELSAIFSVPAAFLGGFTGIAIVRAAREKQVAIHPFRLWAIACVPALLPLCAAFLAAASHALRDTVRNCTPAMSVAFFALMPLASAAFAAACGVVFARALRSHRTAGVLFGLLVLGSLARTAWHMADGPAIFAANHFFGWFPGPIYDEALEVDAPLLWLRFLSLLIALAALLASALFPDQAPAAGRAPDDMPPLLFAGDPLRDATVLGFVLLGLAVASGYRRDFRIDIRRADVQAALGGHVRTEHFDIWFDAGTSPERVALLVQDHEFRHHAVTTWMGVETKERVTSYVFPGARAKKRWTGAGGTQVANPLRREIYLNGVHYPHPVLEHELAHVVSAELGMRPFVMLDVGLFEGIAVAAAWRDSGRGNPHEESAAMLRENLLPDATRLMGIGFWADRQARAYTAAGSFVRFLVERHGPEKLHAVWASGDFEEAYGKPLGALGAEWREFLATIEVPPARATAARERFTAPSILELPCARELSRLEEEGWAALNRRRFAEAREVFERWRAIDDRVEPVRALFHVSRRSGDLAQAEHHASRLLEREIERSPMWWRAKMHLAEIAWERAASGAPADAAAFEAAERGFDEVLSGGVSSDLVREAWLKREGVRHDRAGETAFAAALRAWFDPVLDSDRKLVAITEAATTSSGRARFAAAYVLGRGLVLTTDPAAGVTWLDRARDAAPADLPVALAGELHAVRADALTRLSRLPEAASAWETVRSLPGAPRDLLSRAEDGLDRVRWLETSPVGIE